MSLKKLLDQLMIRKNYTNKFTYEDLVNAESELGKTIFGQIPAGHQREFFMSRDNTWIWHENWTDELNKPMQITIMYEVRPNGVFKKADNGIYQKIEGEELNNFRLAAKSYLELVKSKLYC